MNCHVFLTVILVNIFCVSTYRISSHGRFFDNDREVSDELKDILEQKYNRNYKQDDDEEDEKDSYKHNDIQEELGKLPANGEMFEGDIIMDQRLKETVLGVSKKSALKFPSIKWPGGVLVYEIDKSFEPCALKLLKDTMKQFNERTCITFKERTDEKDYVIYTSKKNQCSSNIGRVGGSQEIFIGIDCCVLGTVEHESMHALGFVHEHSRPDRDDYVSVKWDNIEKEEWSNFNKYKMDQITNVNVDYNFASVMHYRNDAFTKNGQDTLIVPSEPKLKFGQRIKFSDGDVEEINGLYECKAKPGMYKDLFKTYSGKAAERRRDLARKLLKKHDMDRNLYDHGY